jgi:arginase
MQTVPIDARKSLLMQPQVITVPYRYDQRDEGLGLGPARLLEAGLDERAAAVNHASLDQEAIEEDRTAVNIGRLGRSTAGLVAAARATLSPVLVIAGDDTAAVGVVSGLQMSDGASRSLGVIWVDAHGDFNTPDTSYSGILAGMPLAVIAGLAGPRWREAAELAAPIPGDRMLLVGVREIDKGEEELIQTHGLGRLTTRDARDPEKIQIALAELANRCELLYVNVDLDILDPRHVPSITTPSAEGLELDELSAVLSAIVCTGKVAAVSITSLNPLAGSRGDRSVDSASEIVDKLLDDWSAVPPLPA